MLGREGGGELVEKEEDGGLVEEEEDVGDKDGGRGGRDRRLEVEVGREGGGNGGEGWYGEDGGVKGEEEEGKKEEGKEYMKRRRKGRSRWRSKV